jgi:hypothetical protein
MKRAWQRFAESCRVSAMALRDLPKLAASGFGKRVGAFEFGELCEQRDVVLRCGSVGHTDDHNETRSRATASRMA